MSQPTTPNPKRTIPSEFAETVNFQISHIGCYRTATRIEFTIKERMIEIITKSRTIPLQMIPVKEPIAIAPEGIEFIRTSKYESGFDGECTEEPFNDIFTVRYERKHCVTRIEDDHAWWAPVTNFEVSFEYGPGITCGIKSLYMPAQMPHAEPLNYKKEYSFLEAALSSQGFRWFVEWAS